VTVAEDKRGVLLMRLPNNNNELDSRREVHQLVQWKAGDESGARTSR